jgi:hypothetical protein
MKKPVTLDEWAEYVCELLENANYELAPKGFIQWKMTQDDTAPKRIMTSYELRMNCMNAVDIYRENLKT